MITIKDCVLSYIENEGMDKFNITLSDSTTKVIYVEKYSNEDESLVEFYNQSNEIVARAKGFTSVI
jgi:predicted secreted protein